MIRPAPGSGKKNIPKPAPKFLLWCAGSCDLVGQRFDHPCHCYPALLPCFPPRVTIALLGPELPAQPECARRTHPFARPCSLTKQSGQALGQATKLKFTVPIIAPASMNILKARVASDVLPDRLHDLLAWVPHPPHRLFGILVKFRLNSTHKMTGPNT